MTCAGSPWGGQVDSKRMLRGLLGKGISMNKSGAIVLLLVLWGCASQEMLRVRQMDIQTVDISSIPNGAYPGSFSYGGFDYKVKTMVKDHRIVDIEIVRNRATTYAKRAEGVVSAIIREQTPDVDAVSGATTTSKAIMKAVENSLKAAI